MKSLFLSSLNYEDQNTALNTRDFHEDTVIGGIMHVPYKCKCKWNRIGTFWAGALKSEKRKHKVYLEECYELTKLAFSIFKSHPSLHPWSSLKLRERWRRWLPASSSLMTEMVKIWLVWIFINSMDQINLNDHDIRLWKIYDTNKYILYKSSSAISMPCQKYKYT